MYSFPLCKLSTCMHIGYSYDPNNGFRVNVNIIPNNIICLFNVHKQYVCSSVMSFRFKLSRFSEREFWILSVCNTIVILLTIFFYDKWKGEAYYHARQKKNWPKKCTKFYMLREWKHFRSSCREKNSHFRM